VRGPTTAGTAAAVLFLAADAAWLLVTRPAAAIPLAAFFLVLGLVGCLVPGLANQVTLARAHLAGPGLVYALRPETLGTLAIVVALAGATDLLDGAIARRLRATSGLGGGLDPVVDGLFFGAVALGLAAAGAYPGWLAAVVLLRYLLPATAGGILLLAGRRPRLRHTPLGQLSTAVIAVVLGGLGLLRAVGREADLLVAVSEVAIPATALATFANLFWVNRDAMAGSVEPRRG
jgi:phosphatidylglycerophosphate synthase